MSKKEKKVILPNECSWLRWLAALVVAILLGTLMMVPLVAVSQSNPNFLKDSPIGFMAPMLLDLANLVTIFLGLLIAIPWIAKTSIRAFVIGDDKKLRFKDSAAILGLYILGLAIPFIVLHKNVQLRGVDPQQFLYYVIAMLLLVWMQTTAEELVFRGIFTRYACGNKIATTKKSVIAGLISSALFMAMHFANPEFATQSGLNMVFSGLTYFLSGAFLYFMNLHFKSLMPGILVHWLNNFISFVVISSVVSVSTPQSIFVDMTNPTGLYYMVSTIVAYAPIFIYIFIRIAKRKKAAA